MIYTATNNNHRITGTYRMTSDRHIRKMRPNKKVCVVPVTSEKKVRVCR